VLGTIVPPLVRGQVGTILANTGSGWVLTGIALGALGIACCGAAGRLKELDLRAQAAGLGEFALVKGLLLSLVAGVLSAVYGFALDVTDPVVTIAEQRGAGHWKGNVSYLTANTGAFVTSLVYSLWLARKHRTLGELTRLAAGPERGSLFGNYGLAFLTGTLWYGQFFFYNLGHVRLGKAYGFTSWAIHMIMLVLLSNVTAVLFREWKGCRARTQAAIGLGLAVLVAAVLFLTYGNYVGAPAVT